MHIKKNTVVSIDYTLTDADGTVLDSSKGQKPLDYLHGSGSIIAGLEEALEGRNVGDRVKVTVPPDKGYGTRDEALSRKVPRKLFDTAREIKPAELPEVSWDFAYGTNLQHALALSRRLLANRPGAKQVVLITDGEPTAHALADGEVFFHYPPAPETIRATLLEVDRCTRERITVNTFVLDATGSLRAFVEQMTRRNKGRAFFTTPERLGDYVLLDFVEHRRASRQRRLHPGA